MLRLSQLHERTRRRIGLSAFVMLCLVPTIGMFTWGVSRHLPSEEAAMEERLSRLFGLKVTIASVEHPEPGVLLLRDLVFQRPGLDAVVKDEVVKDEADKDEAVKDEMDKAVPIVARLSELRIDTRRGPASDEKLGETLRMTGTGLEVNRGELPELVRLFREAVDSRLCTSKVNLRLAFDRVRLLDGLDRFEPVFSELLPKVDRLQAELSSVLCELFMLEDGPRAVVDFRLVDRGDDGDDTSSELMRLQVGRRLNQRIWYGFNSGTESLSCRLLGMLLPEFSSLGPDARFRGSFWAESTPDGWEGALPEKNPKRPDAVATFLDVDLEHLVGRRFSQTIRGRVDVTIKEGIFTSGRIETLSGRVDSRGSGEIGQPLLAAAVKELGLRPEPLYTSGPVTSYEGLRAFFTLDQSGIFIQGGYRTATGEEGVLLHRGNRPILLDYGQRVKVAALLRTLAPGAASHIPAVRSVEHLARRLPAK